MRWGPTILLCVLLGSLLPAAWAAAQSPPPSRQVTEPVLLNTNSIVQKRLAEAADYLVDERWGEAIDVIAQVSDAYGETLVEVSPRRYLSVAGYCQILLSRLPSEALRLYREEADARARLWYKEARENRLSAPLQRIIDSAFASSYGDDALWLLGEFAWEEGEVPQARHDWEMLLPVPPLAAGQAPVVLRYPDIAPDSGGAISPAAVRARLILCSLCEGAMRRAELELNRFRELHPQAEGELAGQSGRYVDLLDELYAQRHTLVLQTRCEPWTTVGGAMDRNGYACRFPASRDDVRVQRNQTTPAAAAWSVTLSTQQGNEPMFGGRRRPPSFPVSVDGRVFVCDDASISAYDLASGRPAWPVDNGSAVIYPPVAPMPRPRPDLPLTGAPAYTLTVDEGRLYARLGPPVTLQGPNEFRACSELVCLDVATGEGKLVWRVPESVLRPVGSEKDEPAPAAERPAAAIAFEGSPLVVGERLYVAARRGHPQVEAYVACFDVESGALLWNRRVCTSLSTADAARNRVSHQLLATSGDRLFYCTDLGAVAALSCADGRVQWVRTYNSTHARSMRSNILTPGEPAADPARPSQVRPLTGLVAHGTFFVAPVDSDRLLAIRAADGILLWERQLNDTMAHLLGYARGKLFVSGQRLWCLNVYSGEVLWNFGYSDPAGYGFGRGFVGDSIGSDRIGGGGDDCIYWPTREEIFVLASESGAVLARVPLMPLYGLTGGNLLAADGRLIVSGPERLTVFAHPTPSSREADLTSGAATREDEDNESD